MCMYIYIYSNINHLGAQPPIALWFLGVGHQTLSTSPAVLNRKLDNVADFTKPRVLSNRPNGFYQTAGRFLLWAPRTNRDPKRQDCASFSNWSQGSWSVWNMKAKPKMRIHETFQGKSRTNSWWRLRCSNRNFVEGVGHHQEYQTTSEPIGGNKVVALSPGSFPQSCAQELCDKQNVLFFRYLNPWTQLSSGKNGTKGVFFQGRITSWKK